MPEVKDLGVVIASREMAFVYGDGRKEKAFLKVGMPFEYGEGLDWCCPYELSTESNKKLFGQFGIDALQALELTMKTLSVEIEHWEKTKKGKFHFLDEEGAANMISVRQTAHNFLFEPTRCDGGAVFSVRAPRGSIRRWASR